MNKINSVNEFVIKFANVNGSGSASANQMFAKGVFRMGIPVSPKNIFPSNIQGLPTWFEVRVTAKGYLGRREGVDISVAMNPQSYSEDISEIKKGGYLIYDSTWKREFASDDINIIGIPLTQLCVNEFSNPKLRLLFKNIVSAEYGPETRYFDSRYLTVGLIILSSSLSLFWLYLSIIVITAIQYYYYYYWAYYYY